MIKNLKSKHTQMSPTWQRLKISVFFKEARNTKWKDCQTPIQKKGECWAPQEIGILLS